MLYSCKPLFEKIKAQVGAEIDSFPIEDPPRVCIITTGDDEPSERYVRNKLRDFAEVGIEAEVKNFDTLKGIMDFLAVENINIEPIFDGIIVQRPILVEDAGSKLSAKMLAACMCSWMDIDGIAQNSGFVPPSVRGLDLLLREWNYDPAGKMAVVIGRGDVGRPVAEYLLGRDATVAVCHSRTTGSDREILMQCADILVGAAGLSEAIYPFESLPGIVIDYGITKGTDGKLHGDFTESAEDCMQLQTPVPGGMGLMVRAALLLNILDAYKRRRGNRDGRKVFRAFSGGNAPEDQESPEGYRHERGSNPSAGRSDR